MSWPTRGCRVVYGLGPEDDAKLGRAKLVAGVLSIVVLMEMLVTSLFRAPNSAWTALLAVVTGALIVVMSSRRVRQSAGRRRRFKP